MAKGGKFLAKNVPHQKMHPRSRKKAKRFYLGMFIYALLFLIATASGLAFLWDYMSYYETARPAYALDAYLSQLPPEYIYDKAEDLTSQLNYELEPEADCRAVVAEFLSSGVRYTPREKQSNDVRKVYALLCDGKTIGTVTLVQGAESRYGFHPWSVSEDSFTLSFLLKDPVTYTVPADYTVQVNGTALGIGSLLPERVPYQTFRELYEVYDLPTMVTYQAGPFLKEPDVLILNPDGQETDLREESFLNNCSQAEREALDEFIELFIPQYVAYASSSKTNRQANMRTVLRSVVEGSDLDERIRAAYSGLLWGHSQSDEVASIDVHCLSDIGGGRYFVDLTYTVDSLGNNGMVQVVTNAKLIVLQTGDGFLAEYMIQY